MFKLTLLFSLTFTFGNALDGKIVGGDPANIEDYPYQISFGLQGSHFCGGTIINENTILTAAHCTDGKEIYRSYMTVRAGSKDTIKGGQVLGVQEIRQHKDFDMSKSLDNDIAILKLDGKLKFGTGVSPAQLEISPVPPHTSAVCTGWGVTRSGGSVPERFLRRVSLNVISDKECQQLYSGSVTDNMICTLTKQKDSCQGDSGGPLFANEKLIGIVSWGLGCAAPQRPGVYTKVSNYLNWIKRNSY